MGKGSEGERQGKPSALQRAIESAIGEQRRVGREDDPAAKQLPNLWEWLTLVTDPEGKYLIQPATISIRLEPEGVNVSVTSRDLKCSAACSCPHLQDALQALEIALTGPNPPVRTWGKDEPHLRKRRRKD